jgi:hypothetical protein
VTTAVLNYVLCLPFSLLCYPVGMPMDKESLQLGLVQFSWTQGTEPVVRWRPLLSGILRQ